MSSPTVKFFKSSFFSDNLVPTVLILLPRSEKEKTLGTRLPFCRSVQTQIWRVFLKSFVTISPDTRGRKADPEEKIFFFKKKNINGVM